MLTLKKLVEAENYWLKKHNQELLSLDSKEGRQNVASIIDSRLSPENLSCDGELPRSEVEKKFRFLSKAAQELKAMDPEVKFYET